MRTFHLLKHPQPRPVKPHLEEFVTVRQIICYNQQRASICTSAFTSQTFAKSGMDVPIALHRVARNYLAEVIKMRQPG